MFVNIFQTIEKSLVWKTYNINGGCKLRRNFIIKITSNRMDGLWNLFGFVVMSLKDVCSFDVKNNRNGSSEKQKNTNANEIKSHYL